MEAETLLHFFDCIVVLERGSHVEFLKGDGICFCNPSVNVVFGLSAKFQEAFMPGGQLFWVGWLLGGIGAYDGWLFTRL